jgi:membrane protein
MKAMKRLLHAVDAFQQRHRWLAFPIAAWKKFGDDQAGNLAALIAYYAFVSIFPLLLVLVTVLDIVVRDNPALHKQLLDSALASFPVIGHQLTLPPPLKTTGIALVIGLVGTFLGAQGVANAVQNALNSAWEVPFSERPGFPWSLLRNLGMIVFVGTGEIFTVILSGVAGGAGHLLTGAGGHIGTVAVSLVLNIGLFWLAFRLATARQVAARDLRLGAVLAAIAWQALQILGGYLVSRSLAKESLYGVFGIVLGLIAWLYLQAQITLYAVEINVVHTLRLWPRSLAPPPLTEQDVRAYELYARVTQRRPELEIDLHPAADPPASETDPEKGAPEAGGLEAADPQAGGQGVADPEARGHEAGGHGVADPGARGHEAGGHDRRAGKQAASHPE